MSEENKVLNVCVVCNKYSKPKCKLTNEFVSRKNEACDSFELNKKKPHISKKVVKSLEKSDEELKNEILGFQVPTTEVQKMNRSKTNKKK